MRVRRLGPSLLRFECREIPGLRAFIELSKMSLPEGCELLILIFFYCCILFGFLYVICQCYCLMEGVRVMGLASRRMVRSRMVVRVSDGSDGEKVPRARILSKVVRGRTDTTCEDCRGVVFYGLRKDVVEGRTRAIDNDRWRFGERIDGGSGVRIDGGSGVRLFERVRTLVVVVGIYILGTEKRRRKLEGDRIRVTRRGCTKCESNSKLVEVWYVIGMQTELLELERDGVGANDSASSELAE